MVRQTDSELDWVMYAARRSMPARAMLLAQGRPRRGAPVVAEIQRRHFLPPELATEIPRSDGPWLNRRFHLQERFAAEAERFRTRSLGERARMPQERETS